MNEEKGKKAKRSEIELFAPLVAKFIVACCQPWVFFSGLDRQLDEKSEKGFEWWNFYWSFPATHLSWLVLTFLYGLPLWGLLGAPLVIPACVFTNVIDLNLSTTVAGVIVVVAIWIGLYYTAKHYRSRREVRKIREEVYQEESGVNEA